MTGWREFDQNLVSHSAAHHLTTIQFLLDEFGYARVSDVARHLGITRGSVSVTLKGLRHRGLVVEDEHKHLSLSAEGQRIARGIRTKRILIQALFRDVLGVPDEIAEQDACKIEHLISDLTAEAAASLLEGLEETSEAGRIKSLLKSARSSTDASSPFPGTATQQIADRLLKKAVGIESEDS